MSFASPQRGWGWHGGIEPLLGRSQPPPELLSSLMMEAHVYLTQHSHRCRAAHRSLGTRIVGPLTGKSEELENQTPAVGMSPAVHPRGTDRGEFAPRLVAAPSQCRTALAHSVHEEGEIICTTSVTCGVQTAGVRGLPPFAKNAKDGAPGEESKKRIVGKRRWRIMTCLDLKYPRSRIRT